MAYGEGSAEGAGAGDQRWPQTSQIPSLPGCEMGAGQDGAKGEQAGCTWEGEVCWVPAADASLMCQVSGAKAQFRDYSFGLKQHCPGGSESQGNLDISASHAKDSPLPPAA